MMSEIFDANCPCHLTGKNFFLDTCVWIAIYGNGLGISKKRWVAEVYSDYYSSILNNCNTVFVNEFVISEFFNRMCKLEYDIMFPGQGANFKHNRSDPSFVSKMKDIKEICVDIVSDSNFSYGSCCNQTLKDALNIAMRGSIDVTDALILKTCSDNQCVLVSDDRDFKNCGVDLATANSRLLVK